MKELWKTMRNDIHHGYGYFEYRLENQYLDTYNIDAILESRNNLILFCISTCNISEGEPSQWFQGIHKVNISEFMKFRYDDFEKMIDEAIYYDLFPCDIDEVYNPTF